MSSRYSEMTKYAPNDSAAIGQMTGSRHAALAGKLAASSLGPVGHSCPDAALPQHARSLSAQTSTN